MHHMQVLKNNLNVITDVVPKSSKILYLDIPLHLNVGDLLIMKGTEQFFKENQYRVVGRYTDKCSREFVEKNHAKIDRDTIIVLHGGGNFGDLYLHHQILRETVVKLLPNHKVVVLPQTAHFTSFENMRKSAEIMSQHKDLTIFARDINSFNLFKENFTDKVIMCPDMAHAMWNIWPQQKPEDIKREQMMMIRKDIEGNTKSPYENNYQSDYVDWEDICTDNDRLFFRAMCRGERINNKVPGHLFPTINLWYKYTDKLVDRVNDLFLSYGEVVTSRMHGHILSALLGVKTKVLDNSYGKNSGYYESWTNKVPNCDLIPYE